MTRIFVTSDHHFGHANTWYKFKREDGSPLRPFTSTHEMDETMVYNWNTIVRPEDHVYCLGDFAISKKSLSIAHRLMGHKRLVRGNHDIFKTKDYIEAGFDEIYGVRVWPKHNVIMSHIPLHPSCLTGRGWINLHGHLHANIITGEHSKLYKNVCVEHTNYTPILAFEV